MKSWIVSFLVCLGCGTAFAQAAPTSSATVEQIVEKLAPPPVADSPAADSPPVRRTRNLVPMNRVPEPTTRSIDLVIQFDFNSAKLQEASKPLLDNLIAALKSDRLAGLQFKIEGHTDAKGSENYNRQLSQNRAQAVATYLASHGIDSSRMTSEGKGFGELLFPDRPEAPENRRVRITVQ